MPPLDLRVFAYLVWACAARREVSYRGIGRISLPNGTALGVRGAVAAVHRLADGGLIAVRSGTPEFDSPLSVRVAGHQSDAFGPPQPGRTPDPEMRDRFAGMPDPGARETVSVSQVRGSSWPSLPLQAKIRRSLWGAVHGRGPMICFQTAQYEASHGRPPNSQELAQTLGWLSGTPVIQAIRHLLQTDWLVRTGEGLLRAGPAFGEHLADMRRAAGDDGPTNRTVPGS
ncbi:hypothetical protein [Streptomyces sp. NPDC051546]|uniref:hypothetical protein n=1 Tax=Streptomyces sp. NPDC051546 TaxID=3365655 RepID=UPI003796FA98